MKTLIAEFSQIHLVKPGRVLIVCSIALFMMWAGCVYALDDSIPLTITEVAGVVRNGEPVTYGVPFAKADGVTDTGTLGIFDADDQEIAAQFRVLSRYNGPVTDTAKPIRVVLVDFQVDQIDADQQVIYYLKDSGIGTVAGTNLASEDAGSILIDTGKLTAKISKTNFNLFEEVTVGGQNIVSGTPDDGIIVDYQGVRYTSNNAPSEITIEENGPLRAVVKVQGFFEDSDGIRLVPPSGDVGLEYTVRFVFFKDKSEVKVTHTLMSNNFGYTTDINHPVHNINLTSLKLKTSLNLSDNKTVDFGGHAFDFTAGRYELLQDHPENTETEAGNFTYIISKDGTTSHTLIDNNNRAGRFDSYTDLRDENKGLMVASRWFWQNWPKGIAVNDNSLEFYLWPDMAEDHVFVGSWYKTHEMIYDFHADVESGYGFKPELATLKKRLLALVSDEYLSQTDFIDFVPPVNINTDHTFAKGEKLAVAIERWNRGIRAKYDTNYSNFAHETFDSLREIRPFTWQGGVFDGERMNWYGWVDYGDMPRSPTYGFPALHYNWEYISLIHGIRFQDYDMIELGEQMARHKADIDIIHDPEGEDEGGSFDEDFYRGGHRYEGDAHYQLGNWNYPVGSGLTGPFGSSHTWIKGLALQYLLTGDEYYLDVLDQIGEHLVYVYWDTEKSFVAPWSCKSAPCWDTANTRTVTRGIHLLVDLYRITGEEKYLTVAKGVFNNSVLATLEVKNDEGDPQGYLKFSGLVKSWCCNEECNAHMFYESIAVKPILSLYYELKSSGQDGEAIKVFQYLQRKANWLKDKVYTSYSEGQCGTYGTGENEGRYLPYITKNDWREGCTYDVGTTYDQSSYSLPNADLFALIYKETGDTNWLELARVVFKDGMMYKTSTRNDGTWHDVNLYEDFGIWQQLQVLGFYSSPNSAWLKPGKTLHKPMFYLKVEAEESRKNPHLSGAILALRVVSGFMTSPGGTVADVNDDGVVGLAEAVYAIKTAAGVSD